MTQPTLHTSEKQPQPRTTPRHIQPHKRRRNDPVNALSQWTRQRRRWRRTMTQTIASTQRTFYPTTRKRSIKLRPTRKQHHHKGCWQIKETAKPQRVPKARRNTHTEQKSKAEQSHRTCHRKGVLDITYLTIHVDAGVLAFTRCKNLSPRHLPPRPLSETSKTHYTT